MNQLYNQVSGHIVGYIGFITNNMANYLNAVELIIISFTSCKRNFLKLVTSHGPSLMYICVVLILG